VSVAVHWSGTAIEHLAGIAEYIGRTSPLYAQRTVDRPIDRAATLGAFPEMGRRPQEATDDSIREILEPPYRILYLAQPTRVDILAVVHSRQHLEWPN
jgi:toxin ParE1/3/4